MDLINNAVNYALTHEAQYIEQLKQLLAIPSISTLPAHQADVQRAAEWIRDECTRIGLENAQLLATAGNPVVYADWLHADESAPTILIYGHYDVQPPDPLELWDSPPFKPTLRDGKIYARGASDNKAQFFSHLKAIESILTQAGKLPINIKLCLDGEEEIASPNMATFTAAHQQLLATDVVVVSDGAMVDSDNPTIEYALRGVMTAVIHVSGPARDLHSGSYGGTVHNPAQAMAEIVAALHDEQGRVAIPGFYEDVQPLTEAERAFLQSLPYTHQQWQTETGAPQVWGDERYTILERITALPTCEVNGIWGGVNDGKMKTIIPATAGANLSMRLVANQDPAKIGRQLQEYVLSIAPPTVKVSVKIGSGGAKAAVTPYDSPFITAAQTAYRQGWQAEAHISRAGGSLPIVATFQDILGCPFVLMPFGLDDNRHSPNEHYHLSHLRKGIATAVHFYYELRAI